MTDDLKTCLKAGNYMRACALIKTEDVHELLEIDGQVKSPLWFAARFRLPETVALLLKLGADPNQRFADGTTPAHAAALFCYYENANNDHVVEMLAKAGADFDAPNALLWTARDILNELEIPFPQ